MNVKILKFCSLVAALVSTNIANAYWCQRCHEHHRGRSCPYVYLGLSCNDGFGCHYYYDDAYGCYDDGNSDDEEEALRQEETRLRRAREEHRRRHLKRLVSSVSSIHTTNDANIALGCIAERIHSTTHYNCNPIEINPHILANLTANASNDLGGFNAIITRLQNRAQQFGFRYNQATGRFVAQQPFYNCQGYPFGCEDDHGYNCNPYDFYGCSHDSYDCQEHYGYSCSDHYRYRDPVGYALGCYGCY